MMKKALICLDGRETAQSAQLLEVVNRIYEEKNMEVHAAVFGEVLEEVKEFFDGIHQFQTTKDQSYDMRWMAACLSSLHADQEYSCIVVPATFTGRMLAPVLAMRLKTGLVADVTDVRNEDGVIQMIRPAFDGKLMAGIINQDSNLVLMSVRLGAFKYERTSRKNAKITVHESNQERKSGIRLIKVSEKQNTEDIRDAKVLVSGGGGVMGNFEELHRLAKPLNAMVASSRRLVDSNIAPRRLQVGQSGKIVSPRLYIALGIYGSLQHIEGLDNVPYIISVNTNKNAPICSLSTIVVEGDAIEFIEKLSTKIIKEKTKES